MWTESWSSASEPPRFQAKFAAVIAMLRARTSSMNRTLDLLHARQGLTGGFDQVHPCDQDRDLSIRKQVSNNNSRGSYLRASDLGPES